MRELSMEEIEQVEGGEIATAIFVGVALGTVVVGAGILIINWLNS